jgi:hypothetical protein
VPPSSIRRAPVQTAEKRRSLACKANRLAFSTPPRSGRAKGVFRGYCARSARRLSPVLLPLQDADDGQTRASSASTTAICTDKHVSTPQVWPVKGLFCSAVRTVLQDCRKYFCQSSTVRVSLICCSSTVRGWSIASRFMYAEYRHRKMSFRAVNQCYQRDCRSKEEVSCWT